MSDPIDDIMTADAAVPFDYDGDALDPERWDAFLAELWGEDVEQVRALQEWFGYVISGRTDEQKIMLLCGPTRGGKGAIARVLTALVGTRTRAGRRCPACATTSACNRCSESRSRSSATRV